MATYVDEVGSKKSCEEAARHERRLGLERLAKEKDEENTVCDENKGECDHYGGLTRILDQQMMKLQQLAVEENIILTNASPTPDRIRIPEIDASNSFRSMLVI